MESQKEKSIEEEKKRKNIEYYERYKRRENKKEKDNKIEHQFTEKQENIFKEKEEHNKDKKSSKDTTPQESVFFQNNDKYDNTTEEKKSETSKELEFIPKRPLNVKLEIIKQIELKIEKIDTQLSITKPKKLEELEINPELLPHIQLTVSEIDFDVPNLTQNEKTPPQLIPLIVNPPLLKISNINSYILIEKEEVTIENKKEDFLQMSEEEKFIEKEISLRKFRDIILSGKPLVLFLFEPKGNNIIYLFERIFEHIYREKEGGNPQSLIISISEKEKDKEEFVNEIRWIEAEGKILTFRFEDIKTFVNTFLNFKKPLINRINQLFTQKYGVIIFNIAVENREEFDKEINNISPLLDEIRYLTKQSIEIVPIFITDSSLSVKDKKKFIEKLTGVNVSQIPKEVNNIGQLFEYALKIKEDILHNLKEIKGGLYYLLTRPHEGQESEEHRLYKLIIVYYLVNKLLKEKKISKKELTYETLSKKIKSEEEIMGVIPDVYFVDESIAFEVETFFGEDREGKNIIDKLRYTIEKYKTINNVNKICIVVDPLSFYLHKKEIINTVKIIGKALKEEGKEIEIWVPYINITQFKYSLYFRKIKI